MDCFNCRNLFDREVFIPIILINCGHTLCKICIHEMVSSTSQSNINDECNCYECGTSFPNKNTDKFPINLALFNVHRKSDDELPKKSEKILDAIQHPKRNRI